MSKIFKDDSDTELSLKTDNEYAKNYDRWRKKEELNRLKTKYQDELDSDSSSSESDDEDGVELTAKVEKDFYKTLACLKNKDPKIYDESIRFFDDENNEVSKKAKKQKNQSVYLKDYERNLILEKGGILSDEEENDGVDIRSQSPTYVEEQQHAKESLKNALNTIEDDNDADWAGIFRQRKKTTEETEKEEEDYKKWLAGQKKEIEDDQIKNDLNPLKEYWNNPNLDDGEKFLKDYILNKRFLDNEDNDYIPTYEEIVHDSDELSNDEVILDKQEEFEHKYNFRFEEPDQEFIKRYPRTMENSIRNKDGKRKQKRKELKERKQKEKEAKMQELKKLQELKRTEIEEKLEKLKEVTGNTMLGFGDEDIEGEFDPEQHDKRMQELFNEKFYEGPEGDQKPEFTALDEELEIENWNHFYNDDDENKHDALHCEDENFNMDCDYNPNAEKQSEPIEGLKNRKKLKKKSKFAEAVSKPKPKFNPDDKTYEEYFDEYYKLDCEDFIGDIPCRFKYRRVAPNDFGLTIEEILMAKERELNKWCSLKKAIQIRPDHVEKYDQIAYNRKAENVSLKKKIFPSLFSTEESEVGSLEITQVADDNLLVSENNENINELNGSTNEPDTKESQTKIKKRKKQKQLEENLEKEDRIDNIEMNDENNEKTTVVESEEENRKEPPKKKQKLDPSHNGSSDTLNQSSKNGSKSKKKKNKKKNKINSKPTDSSATQNAKINKNKKQTAPKSKINKKSNNTKVNNESTLPKISDERLSAYGIKPKKFKNKLKYKK